jgi:hypothetical protein
MNAHGRLWLWGPSREKRLASKARLASGYVSVCLSCARGGFLAVALCAFRPLNNTVS